MESPGYLQLLRRRPGFRFIWLGALVSLAGDWFTLIALYSLLQEHTGGGEAVGFMLLVRFLPATLLGPGGGVVADRLPRRTVMIACDLLRAAVVLGFLLVRTADQAWLAYGLTFVQMSLTAFFEPAEQAAIASTVEPGELVTANTLHASTWSVMLSVGAVAGGVVTALVGRGAAFGIDAASYLLSALFISQARIPQVQQTPRAGGLAALLGLGDVREGLARVRGDARLRRTLFVKAGWAVSGGGALVLYAVLGRNVFPVLGSGEAGIGLLLAMRGLGALIGPLVARRVGGDEPAWLERAIGLSFLANAVFWLAFSQAPGPAAAALFLALAHTGVATQWVFSSSLLALQVEDRLRGRIFALDMMLYTVVMAASSAASGLAMDRLAIPPRTLMAGLALLLLASWGAWLLLAPRRQAAALPAAVDAGTVERSIQEPSARGPERQP